MSVNTQDHQIPLFQRWSKVAAGITMLVGSLVLLGWLLNITVMQSIIPGMISIKANTALTFFIAALALLLLQTKGSDPRLLFLRRACAILVTLVGFLTLIEYIFGWNLGFDQLLFKDASLLSGVYPGRMSPVTAFNFLLLGSALLILDIYHRYRMAQSLTLAAGLLSLFAVIGYLYGVESLYRIASFISIALPTAITFLFLCLGILFVRPDQGLMVIVSSDGAAGVLARRLLPAAVVIPILIGFLRLQGQQIGLYGTLFGVAIFAISSIVVFTFLIAWSTASLYRIDLARKQAEEKIHRLNTELEGRVLERTGQLTDANQKLEGQVTEVEQAEAKFRALLEAAPDAIVIINQQGIITLVNSQMENLFGYDRAGLIGKSLDLLVPERFRGDHAGHRTDYYTAPRVRAMGAGLDLYGLRRDGIEFPVEISLSPVETAEGLLVTAAIRDTTSRKQAEANLRQSEERFAKAFRTSPAALSITRMTNNSFLDVNESFLSLFGYTREEVIGRSLNELHINTNMDEWDELTKQFREHGSVNNFEIVFRTKSGDFRNMLLSADILVLEGEAHALTTMLDITDRKQAETALNQERDLMQALMDNIPDNIYFKDTDSRFTRINKAQARFLGVSIFQQAIGKTDADFLTEKLVPNVFTEEQEMFRTGQPIIGHQEFIPTPEGQPRWFSATKVPMHDQKGLLIGIIGISRDITDGIQAEEAVRLANARLTERVNQMTLLNELQEQLQACVAIEEVYQVSAKLLSRLFPAELGGLYIINNSRNRVESVSTWGPTPPKSKTFGLEDCWALRRGQSHLSGLGRANIACRHLGASSPDFSACLPLLAHGETLGILNLQSAPGTDKPSFDDALEQLASIVADSVALALANLKLRETLRQQSIRDSLTDLFNRRYMEETLERELSRAARSQKPVGIIMLDVDHFKHINDTNGHHIGDSVLRQLGHFLKEHTRGSDIACRFGGEEFILILPEASLEQTRLCAERYLQEFRTLPMQHNGQMITSPTLSLGVAAYPDNGSTSDEVLRAADAALYSAKHEGRDRVAVAG